MEVTCAPLARPSPAPEVPKTADLYCFHSFAFPQMLHSQNHRVRSGGWSLIFRRSPGNCHDPQR